MHSVHTGGCITLRAFRLRERHRIPWPLTPSVAGQNRSRALRIPHPVEHARRLSDCAFCLARAATPRRRFRAAKLVRPTAPSIGSTTRHCCRVELPHGCCSRPRSRSTLFSPEASQLHVTWRGPIRAIRRSRHRPFGQRWSGENDSRRLLQPTYSTSTRATARLPRRRVLRSTFGAGGGPFDAVPPASIAHSTLSSRAAGMRSAPPEGCFAVAALSTVHSARSPISDASCSQTQASRVGESRLLRAFVKRHVAFGPRRLPSTGAPRARLRRAGNPPPFPGGQWPPSWLPTPCLPCFRSEG